MLKNLTESARKHGWGWLIGLAIAAVVAILAGPLGRIGEHLTGGISRATNAYLVTADGHALPAGRVSSGRGPEVEVGPNGAFTPHPEWPDGSDLMVYGPPQEENFGSLLGEYVLRARENGEWEPIRLRQTHAEICGSPAALRHAWAQPVSQDPGEPPPPWTMHLQEHAQAAPP